MRIYRNLGFALAVVLLAAVQFGVSSAPARADTANPAGKYLGIVPSLTQQLPCVATVGLGNCYGSLYYNGGPVMTTNKVYAIYWVPAGYSVSSDYESLINRYFSDVSADHGKVSNVYATDTQYSQQQNGATSYIQNNSTFEGAAVDTNPLPALDAVNCPSLVGTPGSGAPAGATPCVTDGQIQNEISTVIKAHNWPVDNHTEFFMFTAKGINSCINSTIQSSPIGNVNGPVCAFSTYCAYHSWYFDSTINPNAEIVYANMPYADSNQEAQSGCDIGQHPNNSEADATINVTSHEHNESITDAYGTGWWDSNPNDPYSGYEDGDLCAWNFGTTQGANGAEYSNTINGHHYFLQQEWSNVDGGCVQQEHPKLTLTPGSGYGTAPFKISALFFNAGDTVPFTFTSAGSATAQKLGTATADASGQLTLMTRVPGNALPGAATVSGTGSLSHNTGTAQFTVLH